MEKGLGDLIRAKSFTDDDRDVAFLVLKLGGRALLQTMSKIHGMPSGSVIQRSWALCQKCAQSSALDTL